MTKEELDAEGAKVGGMDRLVHILEQFLQHKEIAETSLGQELSQSLTNKECIYTFFENQGDSIFPGESAPDYYVEIHKEDYDEDDPHLDVFLDTDRIEVTYGYYAGHCAGEGYSLIFEKVSNNTYSLAPNQDSRWHIH